MFIVPLRLCYPINLQNHCREGYFICLEEFIMGWKHIGTLHQISVPAKESVGECINGRKYPKKMYVEVPRTGMV